MIRACLRLVLLLVASSALIAQANPNFGGKWAPVEGVNPPEDMVVTQTATLLRAGSSQEAHSLEVRLDGTETRNGGGAVTTKAQWEGARLVITHVFRTSGLIQKQVMSLDNAGQLVIETIRERNGQTQTTKSVYKRR